MHSFDRWARQPGRRLPAAWALLLSACGLPGLDGAGPGSSQDEPTADIQSALALTGLDESTAISGRPPSLTRADPALGPDTGYVDVILTGRNFRPGATVQFAGVPASSVTVLSSTQIKVGLPPKPGSLGRVAVRIALPDGRFVERSDVFAYYSDDVALRAPRAIPTTATGELVSADVNKDGKADLVVCGNSSVDVLLGNGNHTFQAPRSYAVGRTPRAPAIVDVNGDGKPDIIVANEYGNSLSVLLGNGDGTFGTATAYPAGRYPDRLATGDA